MLNGGWDLPVSLSDDHAADPAFSEVMTSTKGLLREFADSEPWGWKDPRTSLTLPFWKALIPDLRIVVCLRNPLDVARSLHVRNNTSLNFGLHLWAAYYESILRYSHRHERLITRYANYFHSPADELRRLLEFVGIPVDADKLAAASSIVSERLRHQASTQTSVDQTPEAVAALYGHLLMEAQSGPSATAAETVPQDTVSPQPHLGALPAALALKQAAFAELGLRNNELASELVRLDAQRTAELIRYAGEVRSLRDDRDRYYKQVEQIASTRGWRLIEKYWKIRDGSIAFLKRLLGR